MKRMVALIYMLLFTAVSQSSASDDTLLERFAFGGCNIQRLSQSYWDVIAAQEPQFWIWNGDTIYADHLSLGLKRHEYNIFKQNEYYTNFRSKIPVTGVWDDHDYASNGEGVNYKDKVESQKMILEFLDEPTDSPRWNQEGIYHALTYGPVGRRVKIILLDVRYFREEEGENADVLGSAQWWWLQSELMADDVELTFIVSGTQVIPNEHDWETWGRYPRARELMLNMISWAQRPVILLTGDRHLAEISRLELADGRAVYEFTSSGLTHSTPRAESPNSLRVGPLYTNKNFGVVEIDWNNWPAVVHLQIRAITGELVHDEPVQLDVPR